MSALVAGVGTCVIAAGLLVALSGQPLMGGLAILAGAVLVMAAYRS